MDHRRRIAAGLAGYFVLATAVAFGQPPQGRIGRDRFDRLFADGNFKDAFEGYRGLAFNAKTEPDRVGTDLKRGIECLARIGRIEEIDDFRDGVIAIHHGNWRLLHAAAESFLDDAPPVGANPDTRVAEVGAQGNAAVELTVPPVRELQSDRSRSLQLLIQGLDRARLDPDRRTSGLYFLTLARALMHGRNEGGAWALQSLSPLDRLPESVQNIGYSHPEAPVEPDGTPVFYRLPDGFAKAKNDGERWRWALAQAATVDAGLFNTTLAAQATFLLSQFGTRTIVGWVGSSAVLQGPPGSSLPFGLDTLADNETVARLATGIKRLKLPDEFNPIKIYQTIAGDPRTGRGEEALDALASIFEHRGQLDRAADYLKRSRELYGEKDDRAKTKKLDQLLGAWCEFATTRPQLAGPGASVDFWFRTGRRVRFEAHEILFDKRIKDVKDYISSLNQSPKGTPVQVRPADAGKADRDIRLERGGIVDEGKLFTEDIGAWIVARNGQQYLGRQIAQWDLDLDPPPGHRDRRITVAIPFQAAGTYLLTARMEGGNTRRIVVRLSDTIIVQKSLTDRAYYFVADARTGQPVPDADIEVFRWRLIQAKGKNEFRVDSKTLSLHTDKDGQFLVPATELVESRELYQGLITAKTSAGRFAHLGFPHDYIWGFGAPEPTYNEKKAYVITDRPAYRPGSPVRFKFWVARARYDQPGGSEFAGRSFTVEIANPKGERVFTKEFKADSFGGFDGSFELPSDASLGLYYFAVPQVSRSGGWFSVEEYKKPEFEVKVNAPARPVMLGENVAATISARYYFGGEVSQAKVKYDVVRIPITEQWYPAGRWDWLLGPGYWWFAADAPWYPGWSRWGIVRPAAPWAGHDNDYESVAHAELPIRRDGTVSVEIDTTAVKATHPDHDQKYWIEAEVTDSSRRTIMGKASVLVAREPFRVYTWVDRGHYRAGDTVEVAICAQTSDHTPVAGTGTLKLLKITYDAAQKPVETSVESWRLKLDPSGQARQVIKPPAAGMYRLSATIDDGRGHAIEGGYLLAITGQGYDGSDFRFNDLEIIPDKKEYRPGDTLRLLINTNRTDSTVLLFVRPANSIYQLPRVLRLRGKSTVEEIAIVPDDVPNIFVEAVTVADGKVHHAVRDVAVPPESPVVDIAIEPSRTTYKPGEKAKIKLRLTQANLGPAGSRPAPFAGSAVVAVYDKSVEYITGGSNVPAIAEYFWRWKRLHAPCADASFESWFINPLKTAEATMQHPDTYVDPVRHRDPFNNGLPTMSRHDLWTMGYIDLGPQELAHVLVPQTREPVIRTNFADTAFWIAALATAPDGTAEFEFSLPESLTTWKVKAWTIGPGTKVGQAETEIVTSKNLLVRVQAPRFFVEKDEVVLSANVHNRLEKKKTVQVVLDFEGSVLQPLGETARSVEIAAGSEQRVDWRVKVAHEGEAVIRMRALTDEESDGAKLSFPAHVHGMQKMEAFTGAISPNGQQAQFVFRVPEDRRPDQSRLEVRYSPTLAGALVDALPYLADYPYGCTEQTLNRFLPTVLTQKVLINLGLDLKAIRAKQAGLNDQQAGDPRQRATQWRGYAQNPVFDQAEVAKMARTGIQRLADMQLSEGGWGWFSGFGELAWPDTTALVVHGLQIARGSGLKVPDWTLKQGIGWLASYQVRQARLIANGERQIKPFKTSADDTDALVFMVLSDAGVRHEAMLGFLDHDRVHLSVYGKVLLGLALERLGEKAKLAAVLQNIGQYVVRDDENQCAYLKLPNENYWWTWYGSELETDAFYLKLLARTDPRGDLAPRLAKYVLNHRTHGTYWSSTRDTAFCIEALADYLKASGEDRPDMTVAIAVDGRNRKEVRITPADLFTFDNGFALEGEVLNAGSHTVSFLKRGKGPLYYSAYLTNFTLEDPIKRTGLEIKVDRKVFRLVRDDKTVAAAGDRGQLVDQRVTRYRRELLAEDATLRSGELVEVELEIESKNDYEYLVFEDAKAAGLEAVEIQSGYNGNELGAYVELRDERVAFFVRTLARGKHTVSYRLRAEIPGRFHALPARVRAMYAPELRANSDEISLRVED
jgi:alpha-2-macroglobulin